MRKTKIIATLGPASDSVEKIKELMTSGLDAARINFSHGDHEEHRKKIDNVKQARQELGKYVPLILDTKGPEIRTKLVEGNTVQLFKDNKFTFTTEDIVGDNTKVAVTYKDIVKDISVGSTILVDDGLIEFRVDEIKGNDILCTIINDGELGCNKGVNLPDVSVKLPTLTQKDIDDIKFGVEMGFDYIAASFVRSADDVKEIRRVLEENGGAGILIISKIENREGIDNIDEILDVTDGLMVARGDLGVEVPLEEVPVIQKMLIKKCRQKGKLVITATQMLESMIKHPRPTRAEASDVANAVYDGTDAIMLSGETAKGDYPAQAVSVMARIAEKIESSIDYKQRFLKENTGTIDNLTNAVCHAACITAMSMEARAIVAVSNSGLTVKRVAKYRPSCPILALSPNERVLRQLNLQWGCYPHFSEVVLTNMLDLFDSSTKRAMELGFAKTGDIIVNVGGTPVGKSGTTNTLKVQVVGDILVKGKGIGNKVVSGCVTTISKTNRAFKVGNILVCENINDDMLEYVRKASAVILGTGNEKDDYSYAQATVKALDIPLIIADGNATELVPNSAYVTVDSNTGIVHNGKR